MSKYGKALQAAITEHNAAYDAVQAARGTHRHDQAEQAREDARQDVIMMAGLRQVELLEELVKRTTPL